MLGSKDKIVERGYVGATREASEQAINFVDDLFIMSKEVRRVLKEAKGLVEPVSPFTKVMNLFSGDNYQQAVNLVTGKPLKFSRLNGLPFVFRDRWSAESKDASDAAMPDEITMTFEDVFQAFKQRGVDADTMLDTVENCLTGIHETLTAAQADLQKCVAQDKQLESESSADNYFNLPDYLDSLIPAIEKDLAEADKLSAFDAVGAMQNALPPAQRKMSEATALGQVLLDARQRLFPELHAQASKLTELKFTSHWIDAELRGLTQRANALMKACVDHSIAQDTSSLAEELNALVVRAEEAAALGERIRKELYPEGNALKQRIASTRGELAKQLGLPESQVLRDFDHNPDEHWSTAGKSLEAAGVSVALGQNAAAKAAIEVMLAEVAQADYVLKSSMAAVIAFANDKQSAASELKRLSARLPQVKNAIEDVRRRYVSSTLQIRDRSATLVTASIRSSGAGAPPPPLPGQSASVAKSASVTASTSDTAKQADASENVDRLLQLAASPLDQIDGLLQTADANHREGKVLQAAATIHDSAARLTEAHGQLDRIESYLAEVDSQSRENETELTRVGGLLVNLSANERDPLVTRDTLSAISAAGNLAAQLKRDLATTTAAPNPFEISARLDSLRQTITTLESRCVSDRQANAEAARAVAGARPPTSNRRATCSPITD